MRKTIMALMLTTVLSVCAVSVAAEMAMEGTGSGTGYYTGVLQMLPMGKVRVQINYEGFGVMTLDGGKGLFHNSSQHVLGGMHVVKGAIEDSGSIVITLPSGDKVFMTYRGSGKMGKPTIVKGTFTYVGGTGKVTGIEGGGEFTRYALQPPAKGKFASFSVSKSHWKIIAPKK
ncbi:MAG: hypothetical protein JRJ09_03920 [Deltaproteobacteria bacterium]|nr:hypothetical protein [Deltaproteobacteria bacterium]MBW2351780.1 hypothetical protein [Deltaproteobacteria bacterium]HDZ90138.1 hypothetical protein [Deltaproteobacteria bacterium]